MSLSLPSWRVLRRQRGRWCRCLVVIEDAEAYGRQGAAQARVGRKEGARGSGNSTKRIRLFLDGATGRADLELLVAGGSALASRLPLVRARQPRVPGQDGMHASPPSGETFLARLCTLPAPEHRDAEAALDGVAFGAWAIRAIAFESLVPVLRQGATELRCQPASESRHVDPLSSCHRETSEFDRVHVW